MEVRHTVSPNETLQFNAEGIRKNFLIEDLISPGNINFVYSHYDRVIIGGACPQTEGISISNYAELRSDYFLERRELGIINVGGDGVIEVDGNAFELSKLDCLYIGKGAKDILLKSRSVSKPAIFFLLSSPAHQAYETTKMSKEEASPLKLGAIETSNKRTIYKYIHKDGIASCQLVMGLTVLEPGNVWNTMPAHVHDRRMEAYFYFDLNEGQRVFHLMGKPDETRHIVTANNQAIISPPWSIHSGCGTSNYSFIWGMAGENLDFTDMDPINISDLK